MGSHTHFCSILGSCSELNQVLRIISESCPRIGRVAPPTLPIKIECPSPTGQESLLSLGQYGPQWNIPSHPIAATKITRGVHRTHTPHGTFTGYSAATIIVTSLPVPMHIEQVLSRILCSCTRFESDRLPYIQQRYFVKLKRWGQMLRKIGNSWPKQ